LKNQNQQQRKLVPGVSTSTSTQLKNFLPYSDSVTGFTYTDYEENAILRPRQGFLGGGYLQLGNKKLGGLFVSPNWNNGVFLSDFIGIDNTVAYNLQDDLTTIQNGYRIDVGNYPYIYNTNALTDFIVSREYGNDGYLFSIHTILRNDAIQVSSMQSITDNQQSNDIITPLSIQVGAADDTIKISVGPSTNEYYANISNWGLIGTYTPIDNISLSLQKSLTAIEGGTQGFLSIKNYLTFGNISSLINSEDSSIKYYKIDNGQKVETLDYRFRFISPDEIIKLNVLQYAVDEDKPQEYLNNELIGYNVVNTNLQEYLLRHRGYYEPKSRDIITFWLREDTAFTQHFEKDFLLSNTHINSKSDFSGLIRNYGINKVSTNGNILNIARGSSYKSLYPLVGEVAVDIWDRFSLDSSWDNKFYRNYTTTLNFTEIEGLIEMKEQKSFIASKAMNVPKTFEFQTFTSEEVTFELIAPAVEIGVNNLVSNQIVRDQSNQDADKPKLIINVDLRKRLKRQLTDEITNGSNVNEFEKLISYNVAPMNSYTTADIEKLRNDYLEKNIIDLYETTDIILYAKNQEGIELLDTNLSEVEKVNGKYRVDKDCVVKTLSTFVYQIEKTLDPKVASGFSLSAIVKRI